MPAAELAFGECLLVLDRMVEDPMQTQRLGRKHPTAACREALQSFPRPAAIGSTTS